MRTYGMGFLFPDKDSFRRDRFSALETPGVSARDVAETVRRSYPLCRAVFVPTSDARGRLWYVFAVDATIRGAAAIYDARRGLSGYMGLWSRA